MACSQEHIDRLKAEIAGYTELLAKLAAAPLAFENKILNYTVNGRQVTYRSATDIAQAIPALTKTRQALLVELARCEAGGIQVFYGVPTNGYHRGWC